MTQSVFFSFQYDPDNWRVQQVMNMGAVSGGSAFSPQDWEAVRYKTDAAIEKWIHEQMNYTKAVIVLVGATTSKSRWVRHDHQGVERQASVARRANSRSARQGWLHSIPRRRPVREYFHDRRRNDGQLCGAHRPGRRRQQGGLPRHREQPGGLGESPCLQAVLSARSVRSSSRMIPSPVRSTVTTTWSPSSRLSPRSSAMSCSCRDDTFPTFGA